VQPAQQVTKPYVHGPCRGGRTFLEGGCRCTKRPLRSPGRWPTGGCSKAYCSPVASRWQGLDESARVAAVAGRVRATKVSVTGAGGTAAATKAVESVALRVAAATVLATASAEKARRAHSGKHSGGVPGCSRTCAAEYKMCCHSSSVRRHECKQNSSNTLHPPQTVATVQRRPASRS